MFFHRISPEGTYPAAGFGHAGIFFDGDFCVGDVHKKIFSQSQPVIQPITSGEVMKFNYRSQGQPVIQREMPFFAAVGSRDISTARYVDARIVEGWESYRDAVLWCWEHRPHSGGNESKSARHHKNADQVLFCSEYGVHAPHMSRFVARETGAPMDLRPDLIPAFESFTQWRGLSQYMAKICDLTIMEEVIQARRAA